MKPTKLATEKVRYREKVEGEHRLDRAPLHEGEDPGQNHAGDAESR